MTELAAVLGVTVAFTCLLPIGAAHADPAAPGAGSAPTDATRDGGVDLGDDIKTMPGASPTGAASSGMAFTAAAPVAPGTPVPHPFDVVEVHIYDSPSQVPAGPATVQLPQSAVDRWLGDSAQWWSDNTGLQFDFLQGTRYAAINATCDTYFYDAASVFGRGTDLSYYYGSNRDLLILDEGGRCTGAAGLTYPMYPTVGNVFMGGIMEIPIEGWDGTDATAPNGYGSYPDTAYSMMLDILTHEFGHTIGLFHADSVDCSGATMPGDDKVGPNWDGTYVSAKACVPVFNDESNLMRRYGEPLTGVTLNGLQKEFLGLTMADTVQLSQPTAGTLVTLDRHDTAAPNATTELLIGSGLSEINVEYVAMPSLTFTDTDGIYLTVPSLDVTGETKRLNPATENSVLAPAVPLRPGETYVSPDGSVSVTTVSVSADQAVVNVVIGQGVGGSVSISRVGSALKAVTVAATSPSSTTYRWLRNGVPIAGATTDTYSPALPDPNAVYRVEATTSAAGGSTTRYSRGIVPDDRRFTIDGTATFRFLDANGQPVSCSPTHVNMAVAITTQSGTVLSDPTVFAVPTGEPGVYQVDLPFALTGNYVATASPADQSGLALFYWQQLTAPMAVAAVGAQAALMVAAPAGYSSAVLQVGVSASLPVAVSVTGAGGQPQAGVPVTLSAAGGGFTLADTAPVTGADGVAITTLSWNRSVPPPSSCIMGTVTATVAGVTVTGSPASVYACGSANGHLMVWYVDDDATAVGDGIDAVTLGVRAWDDAGVPIIDQPNILAFEWAQYSGTGTVTVSPVQWDAAGQDYLIKVTSLGAATGMINVVSGTSAVNMRPYVTFQAVPPVPPAFSYTTSTFAVAPSHQSSPVVADGIDFYTGTVTAVDAGGNLLPDLDPADFAVVPSSASVHTSAVTNNHDGTYTVQLTTTVAGASYQVQAKYQGAPVGSQLPIPFMAGPAVANPRNCQAGQLGTRFVVAQKTPAAGASVKGDAYVTDNQCNPVVGEMVRFGANTAGAKVSASSVATDTNGHATVTITRSTAGGAAFSASITAGALPGSPVAITWVAPAKAAPATAAPAAAGGVVVATGGTMAAPASGLVAGTCGLGLAGLWIGVAAWRRREA